MDTKTGAVAMHEPGAWMVQLTCHSTGDQIITTAHELWTPRSYSAGCEKKEKIIRKHLKLIARFSDEQIQRGGDEMEESS